MLFITSQCFKHLYARFVNFNMLALKAYGSGSDDDEERTDENSTPEVNTNLPDLSNEINPEYSVKKQMQICAAPVVLPTVS